jgi:hypothetical protein
MMDAHIVGGEFDIAEQVRAKDTAARDFAVAASHFLKAAFPDVNPGWIDNLRDSFISWICCGTEKQLEQIEAQNRARREMIAQMPPGYSFTPPGLDQQLVDLTDQRDKLIVEIETIKTAIDDYPEKVREMMTVAMLNPWKERLADIEQRLSNIQSALESNVDTASSPAPQLQGGATKSTEF